MIYVAAPCQTFVPEKSPVLNVTYFAYMTAILLLLSNHTYLNLRVLQYSFDYLIYFTVSDPHIGKPRGTFFFQMLLCMCYEYGTVDMKVDSMIYFYGIGF